MTKQTENTASINLLSMVNSHAMPFVIIDQNYQILAINQAYEERYGVASKHAVGRMCYQISHGNNRPCHQEGEECPHQQIFITGKPCVCAHIHCSGDHRLHQVKVTAYPLYGADGKLYMGECIEEATTNDKDLSSQKCMVGNTTAFKTLTRRLKVAASSDAPVLLQGETGTGKELAAEYIHKHSSRFDKPFQIIDSTVFTDNLFESEMFGHVKGAYTGCAGDKPGLFELADGGTLFLDEIGELPATQQAKLLRVLETGEYRRVGGKKTRKTNVRLICATNQQLWDSVSSGTFREDLYYRIACLNILLPGLRQRIDDIPVLARSLIEGFDATTGRNYHFTADAFDRLKQYHYPGNIRELRNILFIALTHSQNNEIDATLIENAINNLPHCHGINEVGEDGRNIHQTTPANTAMAFNEKTPQKNKIINTLKGIEAQQIKNLLDKYQGNRKNTACALGISVRTMYRKLKWLGIN